ncbi:porin family protein [bacterium]|jgi:hypothetical protein|nr:porin family protein [bacterium]
MIYKTLNFATTFSTLLMLSLPAAASERGFYGGLTISQFEAEEQGISSSETGLGIIAGYTFNRYIDLEASVFDAGDHNDLGMKAEGVSLSVVGKYPINDDWQLFAEFGGVSLDLAIDESTTTVDTQGLETLSDGRDSSFFYGFGVKYNIGQWSLFGKNSQADTDADFNIFTLGAAYRF